MSHLCHWLTKRRRILSLSALLAAAACSRGPRLPPTIDFDGEHLTQNSTWSQGQMTAVVWTRPGEKLPAAPLQVGAIVSEQHQTARALNQWISEHAGQRYYDSEGAEDTCRVATNTLPGGGTRVFMTVISCQTGVGRAACVEADEDLPIGDFSSCLQRPGSCWEILCDQRWIKRRDALDRLASNVLRLR
jgi:hypothetical protein